MSTQNTNHVRVAIQHLIDKRKPIAAMILAYKANEFVWLLTQHIHLMSHQTSPVELLHVSHDAKLEIQYNVGFGCLQHCIMEKQLMYEYKMACRKLYKEPIIAETTPIYFAPHRHYSDISNKHSILKHPDTGIITYNYDYDYKHKLSFENFLDRFGANIDYFYQLHIRTPYRECLPAHQTFNPKKGYPAKRYLISQLRMLNVRFAMTGNYYDRAIMVGHSKFVPHVPANREEFLQEFETNPRYVNGHRVSDLYVVIPEVEIVSDKIHTCSESVTINRQSDGQTIMSKFGNSSQFLKDFFKSSSGKAHIRAIADRLIEVLELKMFD